MALSERTRHARVSPVVRLPLRAAHRGSRAHEFFVAGKLARVVAGYGGLFEQGLSELRVSANFHCRCNAHSRSG